MVVVVVMVVVTVADLVVAAVELCACL